MSWEPEDFISKVEDNLLTCGICMEIPYDKGLDYHNLPCQHPICEECVRQIKQRDPEQKLECPTCREVYNNDLQLNSFRFASDFNELRIRHNQEREEAMHTYQENRQVGDEVSRETMNEPYISILKLDIREQVGEIGSICSGEWKIYIVATEGTGFYYLNLITQKLRMIGHQDSHYSTSMVFNEGNLYAYNESKHHVEKYNEGEFVNKWRLFIEDFSSFPDVNKWLSLQPFPNGVLISSSITMHSKKTDFFSVFKCGMEHLIYVEKVSPDNSGTERVTLVSRYLHRNKVLCVYRQSIWFVDKRDTHLMEIPFTIENDCEHEAHLKEPIRHFKIPHYLTGCGFGHTILFITERSDTVHKLDLTGIAPLTELRIRRNNVLYTHAQTPVPVPLFDGPTAGSRSMTTSENGQVTIVDKDGLLRVYQQPSEIVPLTTVRECEQAASRPDYDTPNSYQKIMECISAGLAYFMQLFQWYRFLLVPLESLLFFAILIYLVFFLYPWPHHSFEYLSDYLARLCLDDISPRSIGLRYFHMSLCVGTPLLQPNTSCVFEHHASYDGEIVNVMYINGPKCFDTNISNGLRTTIVDNYGHFIRYLGSDATC